MAVNISAPTQEQVYEVMSMTTCYDENLIYSALQARNNDLAAVVNEFFDDPEKFKNKYTWDESAFASNREGDERLEAAQPPSFLIQGPDENPILQGVDPSASFYGPTAPSRPPSRANNISPMSRLADMASHEYSPSTKQQEDEQLRQAIKESMQTSGIQTPVPLAPQESGILSASDDLTTKYFGPSMRSDYDQGQWAMVRVKAEEPDPEPSRRKRDPELPVFLRCREEQTYYQHRVGHILTILHSIPAARNGFLRTGAPAATYGSNKDWWRGSEILQPELQEAQATGADVTWELKRAQWNAELHRLSAFLDSTERGYGTADLLAGARDGSGDPEKEFYETLTGEELSYNATALTSPFISVVETVPLIDKGEDEMPQSSSFSLFDIGLSRDAMARADTIYNVLDIIFFLDMMYSDDSLDFAKAAVLTKAADVIPIRFGGDDPLVKMLEVPETFYLDRYMSVHFEKMRQVQIDMYKLLKASQKGAKLEQKLNKVVDPRTNTSYDREATYLRDIEAYKHQITVIKTNRQWLDHESARAELKKDSEEEPDDFYYLPNHAPEPNLTDEEKTRIEHIESLIAKCEEELRLRKARLASLEQQRVVCERLFQRLSSLLTQPSEEEKWNPTYKYSLRGVANSRESLYIRRRETDLMELDDGVSEPSEQWWKLSYDPEGEASVIQSEKVSFERVAREACGVGCRPILIYANEKALSDDPLPLHDALKTFLKLDNRLFKMELTEEAPRETKRAGFSDPASPTKRNRVRSDSLDSLATNKASIGSVDDDRQDGGGESSAPVDLLSADGPADLDDDQGGVQVEMQERAHDGTADFGDHGVSILDMPMEPAMTEADTREV